MPSRIKEIMEKIKGIYTLEIDGEGHFISFPSETRNFLGYSKEEILEMTIFDLVSEKDLEHVIGCLRRGEEIEPGTTYDIFILNKSGKRIAIKAEPTAIIEDGKIKKIQCKFRPIDESD